MLDNGLVNLISSPEDQLQGFQNTCAELLSRNELVDCILCCSNGQVQAHRIILACSSAYILEMLSTTPWPSPCSHPMLFFKSVTVEDMRLALEFIYTGKACVAKSKLSTFLSLSQDLGCVTLTKVIEKTLQSCAAELLHSGKRSSPVQTSVSIRPTQSEKAENGNQTIASVTPVRQKLFHNEPQIQSQHVGNQQGSNNSMSCIEDFSVPSNIKIEQSEEYFSSSESSSSTPNESILRSTLTPPLQLGVRRQSPTQQFVAAKRPQETSANPIPAKTVTREACQSIFQNTFPNSSEYQAKNISATYVNGGDNGHHTIAEFLEMADELDDEDGNGNGSIGIEDNELNELEEDEDEEMPITVVDLKSLAELQTTSSSLKNDNRKPMMEQTEVLPANCPWCLQVFTSLTLLQRHIKTHVGNYKPYACEYCTATFARTAHLKRHIRTHTGEKPFVCGICQKAFSRQDKLKTHLERHVHGPNNMGLNRGLNNGSKNGPKTTTLRAQTFQDGRSKINHPATQAYQFLNSNNIYDRKRPLYPMERYPKGLRQNDNQKLISSSTISPSTTITPTSALPDQIG